MGKETITFSDIEVEKHKFHQYKNPILAYDVGINMQYLDINSSIQTLIVVSSKFSFGKKGFKYSICRLFHTKQCKIFEAWT